MCRGKERQRGFEFKYGFKFYGQTVYYACRDEALLFFWQSIIKLQTSNTLQDAPPASQMLASFHHSHCPVGCNPTVLGHHNRLLTTHILFPMGKQRREILVILAEVERRKK